MAIVLLGIFLLGAWWTTVLALQNGTLFVGVTYWGVPIMATTRLTVLIVGTPIWMWGAWRYWNWQGHKVEDEY